MGSELVESPASHVSYTEQFREAFPFYLSIGMTYKQYWEEDCTLPRYYRQAFEIKQERLNQQAWLQGMYTYEALCDVSPVLNAFAKKGAKPHPFPEKPYSLKAKETVITEEEKLINERNEQLKAKVWMNNLIHKFKNPVP